MENNAPNETQGGKRNNNYNRNRRRNNNNNRGNRNNNGTEPAAQGAAEQHRSENGGNNYRKNNRNRNRNNGDRSSRSQGGNNNSAKQGESCERNEKSSAKQNESRERKEKSSAKQSESRERKDTMVFVPIKSEKTKKHDVQSKKDSAADIEYRKKSDRRFWARLASLAAIIPAYLILLVCAVVLPRSTVSNIEKRNLATFPEFTWKDYWSGQYTADVAHYFDDTVPFRDSLKQAASRFSSLFGIKYNDVQVSGTMQVVNPQKKDDKVDNADTQSSAAVSEAASEPDYGGSLASGTTDKKKNTDTDTEKQVKGEEIAEGVYANGVIVVYQDGHYRAMSMYGGGPGDTYAVALNNFASDLPRVKVYSLVAPTASEFYTPKNFEDYNASQEDDIIEINSMLQNVTGINVCPELLKHKKETIYTRTDHHWMSLGAYYAAKEFASAANTSFLDISQYTRKTKPDYVGTLYTFSGNNADLLNDPEDFIYYVPKNQNYKVEYYDYAFNYVYEGDLFADIQVSSEYYSTFISGDAYSVKITTGVKNGRRCLVVKDSYGDALVPFLTGSFEEVYVVDMRYFERNLVSFAEEMDITDLLFTCCSYSAVGPNADNLEVIRTSGYTGAVEQPPQETPSEEPAEVPTEEPSEAPTEIEEPSHEESETTGGDDTGVGLYVGDETGGDDDYGGDDYYEDDY